MGRFGGHHSSECRGNSAFNLGSREGLSHCPPTEKWSQQPKSRLCLDLAPGGQRGFAQVVRRSEGVPGSCQPPQARRVLKIEVILFSGSPDGIPAHGNPPVPTSSVT